MYRYFIRSGVLILVNRDRKKQKKAKQSHYRPGQAQRVPEGSGSQISRQSAHEASKVVSPTHWPPLPPRKYSWYSFLLEAESTPRATVRPEGLCQWKIPMTPSGNRPRDLPACSAVPQPTPDKKQNIKLWRQNAVNCNFSYTLYLSTQKTTWKFTQIYSSIE